MKKALERIINKQFEMIGEKILWKDIHDSGIVTVKVKKVDTDMFWWERYQFKSETQYREWEKWALEELKKEKMEEEWVNLFLLYSMNFPLKKGEQLTLEI